MKLSLPKWVLKIPGDLYFCKNPLWFSYKPAFHKVKGTQIRSILNIIKEGDIIFRRYTGYLDTILMPSFWCHVALYIGDNKVIQALGSGVNNEDILDYCRCDSISLYRPKADVDQVNYALNKAKKLLEDNITYDWKFVKGNNSVYCTELVNECYNNIFDKDYEIIAGNTILTPDGLSKSKLITFLIEFRNN